MREGLEGKKGRRDEWWGWKKGRRDGGRDRQGEE